ncbi:MAG: hypothetical protein ACRERU_03980 [Methylococcales bacterium]
MYTDECTLGVRRPWLEARDSPVSPQVPDQVGAETQTPRGSPLLAVENAGNDGVGIVDCQATHEAQSLFIGADRGGPRTGQVDVEFGQLTTAPSKSEMGPVLVAEYGEDHFFQQGTQEFLLVAGGGRRGEPNLPEIGAERQQGTTFGGFQGGRALLLAAG